MKIILSVITTLVLTQNLYAQNTIEKQCSPQLCEGPNSERSFKEYCMSVSKEFWESVDEWGPDIVSQSCFCPCKKYFEHDFQQAHQN